MITLDRVHADERDGEIHLHAEASRGRSRVRISERAAALLLFDLVAILSKRRPLAMVFQEAFHHEAAAMCAALDTVHRKAA